MDKKVFAISKHDDKSIASGFDHALRTGNNTFSVFFTDGSQVDLTIPLPQDGAKGDRGVSISDATFDANGKLVIELDDGTELTPLTMPSAAVEVSKQTGNIVTQKADGIYAPATDLTNYVQKEAGKGLSETNVTATMVANWNKAEQNVQPDWAQTDATKDNYIQNKPTIPTVDSAISATSVNAVENKVVKEELDKKVNVAQGVANKDKFLKVGSDGNVTLGDVPSGTDIVTAWETTTSDAKVPSEKLVKSNLDTITQELAKKLDADKVVATFSAITSDSKVASEKLVKDSLNDKADKSVIDDNVDNGFLKSHNLVDNSLNVRGYYYKVGGIQEDSHKAMTSAIKVEQGKTYVCSIFDNSGNRINKAVYTSFANANDTSAIAQYVSDTFVPKSGENYVRIRNYDTENAYIVNNDYKYQLEEGTEASTNYYDYAKSNVELTSNVDYAYDNGFVSKNLLDLSNATITERGCTVTLNSNGSITINGTTTSGGAVFDKVVNMPSDDYSFTIGCKGSELPIGFWATVIYSDNTTKSFGRNESDESGSEIKTSLGIKQVRIYINSGVTVSNLTLYPMVRKSSITDATYQLYAKSNVELTKELNNSLSDIKGNALSLQFRDITTSHFEISMKLNATQSLAFDVNGGNGKITLSIVNNGAYTPLKTWVAQ